MLIICRQKQRNVLSLLMLYLLNPSVLLFAQLCILNPHIPVHSHKSPSPSAWISKSLFSILLFCTLQQLMLLTRHLISIFHTTKPFSPAVSNLQLLLLHHFASLNISPKHNWSKEKANISWGLNVNRGVEALPNTSGIVNSEGFLGGTTQCIADLMLEAE